MAIRGPKRPIITPTKGVASIETMKPIENIEAVSPRLHPNSSRIGGYSSENDVRAFTPIPMVTKATAIITQP